MWWIFHILLLCMIVDSSKLFKAWKKDPLVLYVGINSKHGLTIGKLSDEKWSLMLEALKRSLQITDSKAKFDGKKDTELSENKAVLRICSYKHPCKVNVQSQEEKKEDECKEKEKSEDMKDLCNEENLNQCEK